MIRKVLSIGILSSLALFAAEKKFIEPVVPEKVPYSAQLTDGGAIAITLGDKEYVVRADFSLRPGWAKFNETTGEQFESITVNGNALTALGKNFKIERSISCEDEAITVIDKITNTGDDNLPFMYRQYVSEPNVKEYRLCGYRIYQSRGEGNDSINCTAIVMPETGGSIGFVALNDVFRVHFKAYAAKGMYGISDNYLVVKPGVTQEMSFAVFPSKADDYYSQINAMRRYLGVNYEIKEGFTFMSPYPKGVSTFDKDYDRIGRDSTDDEILTWLNAKSANYLCDGPQSYDGEPSHGSAWLKKYKADVHTSFYKRVKALNPNAQFFHYFHCYLEKKPDVGEGIEKDMCLKPNGEQGDYRNPDMPLYLPVEGGKWAEYMEKTLHVLKDEYKVDGIFWDEFPYSAMLYHYGDQWDGVSADINPKTHEIQRLKSSVPLLTLPWRKRMVEWIADNKLMLIANGGGGFTQTMSELFKKNGFVAFEETGSISNLYITHLFTPIGLGDHITERNETDCYHSILKHLDYGSVYYYYHEQVAPFTHETISKYMFPITPVELHEGYIIGKERILTNRTGVYGFGDASEADLHFYDKNGYEVKRKAKKIKKNGKVYYDVKLGEKESCAIVRK